MVAQVDKQIVEFFVFLGYGPCFDWHGRSCDRIEAQNIEQGCCSENAFFGLLFRFFDSFLSFLCGSLFLGNSLVVVCTLFRDGKGILERKSCGCVSDFLFGGCFFNAGRRNCFLGGSLLYSSFFSGRLFFGH